jgi:hypothetical protein
VRSRPPFVEEWTEDLEAASKLIKQRDEYQAVEEATPDLLRLERYYRQVWTRYLLEECQHVTALDLPADDYVARRIDAVDLKNRLRDIQTDCRDRLHG